jgi:hypothetical protein
MTAPSAVILDSGWAGMMDEVRTDEVRMDESLVAGQEIAEF